MGSRDHSETCEVCGESYGGMNSDTEEHECSDMVNVEECPGVYVHRKRRWGECFCHAYDDSECACGGLWEQRETERQAAKVCTRLSNLALCLRDAGALCAAWDHGTEIGMDIGSFPLSWHPGCGEPMPTRRNAGGGR